MSLEFQTILFEKNTESGELSQEIDERWRALFKLLSLERKISRRSSARRRNVSPVPSTERRQDGSENLSRHFRMVGR